MLKEFKEFIARGDVVDMAVGLVVGLAFKAIIDSFVADILNPIIGLIVGGIDLSRLKIVLRAAEGDVDELAISYGNLIQVIISFILIAFFLFLLVKAVNKIRTHKTAAEEEIEEELAPDLILLTEIRDLLKNRE
ncbi:MAG: large-conductance mechanosensitive channel protein MscL [Saccharofermentanales bacterium]|jgi:large conductance mechanosensitive channel|nr:large-conductance mechanosensitive channel protein MscL [Bacillota bacterium]NLB08514.1 large-conductance mechanosensitive channel protein MscL [Clostridiales bacterium]